jgi:hypothetical protein
VYIIQKGNTNVEIIFYMGINVKKEKVTKIHRIEDFIFYLSFMSSVLSRGVHWMSW